MKRGRKPKVRKLSERAFLNLIQRLVNRHGKVRLISKDPDYEEHHGCDCKTCLWHHERNHGTQDKRKRLITNNTCKVSYMSDGHKKWSGFSHSCFMDYVVEAEDNSCECYTEFEYENCNCIERARKKRNAKKIVEALLDHDSRDANLTPDVIEYGKFFKKKIRISLR